MRNYRSSKLFTLISQDKILVDVKKKKNSSKCKNGESFFMPILYKILNKKCNCFQRIYRIFPPNGKKCKCHQMGKLI